MTLDMTGSAGRRLSAAGRQWDAVSACPSVGLIAHADLGDRAGAVLSDSVGHVLWLVPAGSTLGWSVPHTEVYGPCTYVVIPPATRTEGPGDHWLRPPTPSGYLTDPAQLRAALMAAAGQISAAQR